MSGADGTDISMREHGWPTDDLGPSAVHVFRLPAGVEAYVVVDNLVLGPAIGGVRRSQTVTVAEVARLARAMTIKNAVAGLPHGGGKAGIRVPHLAAGHGEPSRDSIGHPVPSPDTAGHRDPGRAGVGPLDAERVVRAFAVAIRELVDYIPGPDMGTDETAMAWVYDEIGRAVGLPALLGGIPLDEIGATGFGLAECARALAAAGRVELAGARVAIQGFGAVGRHAAGHLTAHGARVVAVSDSTGATYHPDGLDVPALVAAKRSHPVGEFAGGKPMTRDDLLAVECDVLVPAAQADAIHEGNVDTVRARVLLCGANLPVTAGAEAVLTQRGTLVVPDVVANAGGVICATVEHRGGNRTLAFAEISERITANTGELLDRLAAQRHLLPRQAALAMARARLATARTYRRRF